MTSLIGVNQRGKTKEDTLRQFLLTSYFVGGKRDRNRVKKKGRKENKRGGEWYWKREYQTKSNGRTKRTRIGKAEVRGTVRQNKLHSVTVGSSRSKRETTDLRGNILPGDNDEPGRHQHRQYATANPSYQRERDPVSFPSLLDLPVT